MYYVLISPNRKRKGGQRSEEGPRTKKPRGGRLQGSSLEQTNVHFQNTTFGSTGQYHESFRKPLALAAGPPLEPTPPAVGRHTEAVGRGHSWRARRPTPDSLQ